MSFTVKICGRIVVGVIAAAMVFDGFAATLRVGPNTDSNCDYNSLGDAFENLADNTSNTIQLSSGTYSGEHGTIDGRTVTIIGSYANCSAATPTSGAAYSIISGAGHNGDSVISIKGTSHVTLQNIAVEHGNENSGDGHGGGIDFSGTGSLDMSNTLIYDNYAKFGGGINVDASGDPVTVTLGQNTSILFNSAQRSGGGIRISGNATLVAVAPNNDRQHRFRRRRSDRFGNG